ncbi:MAG: GspH/FimT family pseudopilin [Oceanospirillaceae bacterium]|nr:GspH/FimT family pseudopilin [Oceanospirillaceae bacterium]
MYTDVCRRPAGHFVAEARGFTLIELLVTLYVLSILMFVAVPDLSDLVVDARISETHNKMRSSLALARTEAVRQNSQVVLCATDDAQQCVGDGRSGKSIWAQVLLFKDVDEDRLYSAANNDELIRVIDLESGGQVVWNRGDSTVYESNGSLLGGANGSFYIFDEADLNEGVKLVLQMTGRVRLTDFSNKDIADIDQYLGH